MTEIKTAMLLAAGLGTRLRPITDTCPKPLVQVNGRTMLDRALDRLVAHGVTRAVVNLHYLGGMIRDHLAARRDIEILFSDETAQLLDTGGAAKAALPLLNCRDDQPFFCINTDLVWTDLAGETPALARLEQAWEVATMDALLLMAPTATAVGCGAKGDYFMTPDAAGVGPVFGRRDAPPRPFVYGTVQVVTPQSFRSVPARVFSNRDIWDAAEAAGRLFGVAHTSGIFHAGTPEDLAEVNRRLAALEA